MKLVVRHLVSLATVTAVLAIVACAPAVSDHDNRIFATPASIKLSAVDLSQTYLADAGAADGRYRGRVLEVSGVIGDIKPGSTSMMLAGAEKGPAVEASLHEDVAAEMLKTAAKDQRITIKCFCEGFDERVRLKSCVTAGR